MKTDVELIAAAAKAAGLQHAMCWEAAPENGEPYAYASIEKGVYWRPLGDDGDALRLALTLHIEIDQVGDAITPDGDDGKRETFIGPADGGGQVDLAATRRAIVRAAAAMAP